MGVKEWLLEQQPHYQFLCPAQKACIEQALKFLPLLEKGLAAAAAATVPGPFSDHDDDDPPPSFVSPPPSFGRAGSSANPRPPPPRPSF